MFRIHLDPRVLGDVRFALSPLHTATDLLLLTHKRSSTGGAGRGHPVRRVMHRHGLDLLAALCEPHTALPGFLAPCPTGYEDAVETELHRVATTPPGRVRREIAGAVDGGTAGPGRAAPRTPAGRALLSALDGGERALAERLADELAQLWQRCLLPQWPRLRSRMESDIALRAQLAARQGVTAMLASLHPRIVRVGPRDVHGLCVVATGGVDGGLVRAATGLRLVPRVFGTDLLALTDPVDPAAVGGTGAAHATPDFRPSLMYPALPAPDAPRAAVPPANDLLGATRATLLADLAVPRSTEQLARRHSLSQSTVSYHLGILHRGGLVTRTRDARRVLYQQTARAVHLLPAVRRPRPDGAAAPVPTPAW